MTADLPPVMINEIAWMGGESSYNDEWIELYNKTDSPINLDGWTLKAVDGSPEIQLTGLLLANSFYLLERSKNYAGALNNKGEELELYDSLDNLIDFVDASVGWPAGDNKTKQTMERIGFDGWQTSIEPGGTPGEKNSAGLEAVDEMAEDGFPPAPPDKSYESYEVKPRKNVLAWWIAGLTAFFSGGIILVLKKKTP